MKSQEEWARELEGEGEVAVPYMPHANYLLPLILGRAEVSTLLACPGLSALQQLALRTLYATGLREEELVALGPDCQSDQWLQILGARPRRVCLDEETARALSQLSGPSLFSTTLEELRNWLLEAARWAGVLERFEGAGRPLLPKALRHAYASHCVENGMDLLTLFYQLGHEFVDTTEMYVLTGVALRGASYARSHPLMAGQKGYISWNQPELMVREVAEPEDEEADEERGLRYARLTLEDMAIMLAAGRTDLHRLIVRVLYATGIRLAELLGLRFLDLDSRECRLFVRQGKGHKDRYCLLDPNTLGMVLAWRGNRGLSEVIFPLPRPSVQKVLTSLAKRTGLSDKYAALGEKLTPHSMRHTFATHCYNGGIDLFSLKTLLGHAYLHTTLAYLACPPERRQQVYDHSHPWPEAAVQPDLLEWASELGGELGYAPSAARMQLPLVPSRSDVRALLECQLLSPLQRLALRTLYATGMRGEELFELELLENGRLQVAGRMLAADGATLEELGQLGGVLFGGECLQQLQGWLEVAAEAVGVLQRLEGAGRPLSPRALRHAYASHCLDEGMDLITLYYLLGHGFLETTQMYREFTVNRLEWA